MERDGAEVTCDRRLFHRRAAATGNANNNNNVTTTALTSVAERLGRDVNESRSSSPNVSHTRPGVTTKFIGGAASGSLAGRPVLQGGHRALKVLEKKLSFFQDLESP